MSIDEQHIALPKLYGAPAYARPPRHVAPDDRPFDPDELPIEAHRTDEEHEFAELLPARAYAPGGADLRTNGHGKHRGDGVRPRNLSLRAIAGRLRRGD